MTDGFERRGRFWLPKEPKNQLDGILKYSPRDGAKLELSGSFGGIADLLGTGRLSAPSVVLGIEPDGKKITLLHCVLRESTIGGGYPTCWFDVQVAFLGTHFETTEELTFASLSVGYLHLDQWARFSYFEFQEEGDVKTITYRKPEPLVATVNSMTVSVSSAGEMRGDSSPPKAIHIEREARVGIDIGLEAPFDEYMRVVRLIQILLTLAVGEAVHPVRIVGIRREQGRKGVFNMPVEIWYKLPRLPAAQRRVDEGRMLFTRASIADRFESILNKWFEHAQLLEPVYDLYYGALSTPGIFEEQRFLTLARAVETLHRRRYGGEYLSRDEYSPVYEQLVDCIPQSVEKSHRDSLKAKLRYGNEFSLRKRLKDIFDSHEEVLDSVVENRGRFISQVKDTRDYLTHYGDNSKEAAVTEAADLYLLGQKLATVLEICLLAELGFRSEQLKRQAHILTDRRGAEPIEWD